MPLHTEMVDFMLKYNPSLLNKYKNGKTTLDYLEKNHVFFQRLESIQEQQMRKVAFNLKQNS